MIINFVGNFQNGYVGEVGDATHIVRELEALGHIVRRIPQDEWREYVIEGFPKDKYPNIPTDLKADINIICKWHHFYSGAFIDALRGLSGAPVLYWVWDYMYNSGMPEFHTEMVRASDLYLGNDVRAPYYKDDNNAYYFPFDVADGTINPVDVTNKDIDVAFFGSCIGQGKRIEWLTEINKTNPVTVFAWNADAWAGRGFQAYAAVYGQEFVQTVARCKVILGFSVESDCWGYWSNRVGKILTLGGFLLYQYAPGMELFLRDGVEYFSSVEEAREKIDHYLIAETERNNIAARGYEIGRDRFTSKERIKDLAIFIERFLKKGDGVWQI